MKITNNVLIAEGGGTVLSTFELEVAWPLGHRYDSQ